METVAVYWESRIKTYGFAKTINKSLVSFCIPLDMHEAFYAKIVEKTQLDIRYSLLNTQLKQSGQIEVVIVTDTEHEAALMVFIQQFNHARPVKLHIVKPVDMISFQGPHFGDRYGILYAAAKALFENGVKPVSIGCSGSSIHLVFKEGIIEKAVNALNGPFVIPASLDRGEQVKK